MEENHETLPLSRGLREWLPPSRTGGATNPATAWRWHRHGCRTPGGGRVHLRTTRIGGRLYLRRADVEEFIRACSAEVPLASAPVAAPAPADLRQAEAAVVLERAGILPPSDPVQAALDRPRDANRRDRRGCRS